MQTSGYESEPSSIRGVSGDLNSADGSSVSEALPNAGGGGGNSEATPMVGGASEEALWESKEEDWVAVQRKKKSSNRSEQEVNITLFVSHDMTSFSTF